MSIQITFKSKKNPQKSFTANINRNQKPREPIPALREIFRHI